MNSTARNWLEAGLGLIYPPVCEFCGTQRATPAEGLVCAACWQNVRFIRPPFCERCGLPFEGEITTAFECANCREMELHFRSARSAVVANGVVLEAIHRYKYQRALWLEPFLADLFVREAAPALHPDNWDCLVPVPLYPAKEREREFNQAARLAAHVSRSTKIPLNEKLLRRVIPTSTQTRLSRAERAANMRGAFALLDKETKLTGQRLVVVDDVLTTGATTSACAKVLKAAGAAEVCVWTVARGL